MTMRGELRECADGLSQLIAEAKARAKVQGIPPYRSLTRDGGLVLAPLLAAQAQVLALLADEPEVDAPVGYVIAERHVWGPDKGRLDVDWDGLVHEDRAAAEAELARANAPLTDDPTQTPADHWKLYELREATR